MRERRPLSPATTLNTGRSTAGQTPLRLVFLDVIQRGVGGGDQLTRALSLFVATDPTPKLAEIKSQAPGPSCGIAAVASERRIRSAMRLPSRKSVLDNRTRNSSPPNRARMSCGWLGRDQRRHFLQTGVAGEMPIMVVVALEVIDIDHDRRDLRERPCESSCKALSRPPRLKKEVSLSWRDERSASA